MKKREVKPNKDVGRPKGIKQPKKGKGKLAKKRSLPPRRPKNAGTWQKGTDVWKLRFMQPARRYTPEEMKKEFMEYIEWNRTEGVWWKVEAVKSGDWVGTLTKTPVVPPLSELGFCIHLGITQQTFIEYKKDNLYSEVTAHVVDVCRKNKLDGANMGFFNANIVARELGLADATKVEVMEGRKNVNEIFGALGLGGENKIEE